MKKYILVFFCKARAEEELQETQGKIDILLEELSSLDTSKRKSLGEIVPDAPITVAPEGALNSHSDMLKVNILLSN